MKRINDCDSSHANGLAVVRDPKTKMQLVITDAALASYLLDDDATWGAPGSRPDGVLISDEPEPGAAIFVELKGRVDPDEPDPYRQVAAAVEHFADIASSHGAEHHALWRGGDDLPRAPHRRVEIELTPRADHHVAGVTLTSRGGTRIRPQRRTVAGKTVLFATVQRHGTSGRSEMKFEELLRAIGL